MGDYAIRVAGLAKQYRLGSAAPYHRFSELLVHMAGAPFRRAQRDGSSDRDLWALKDVSFEIPHGQVVGVIGRNGAGKSTLLKILSRITAPTHGEVRIKGRVGSLLEVGTGFHPELTGRENIYLNGAILGMTRREIRGKFDAIVDFAEIERFLDTPVKRYSSGMYMRLAFAVAAHLEPEILLVDEVLAVGDAAFQKKCLGKMDEVAKGGRTVLFVSHNMGAVMGLCSRAILLQEGRVDRDGDAKSVADTYMADISAQSSAAYVCEEQPNHKAHIVAAKLETDHGAPASSLMMSEPLVVMFDLQLNEPLTCTLSVQVKELTNNPIYHFPTTDTDFDLPRTPGRHEIRAHLDALHLYPGEYLVQLTLCHATGGGYEVLHSVDRLAFTVEQDHRLTARPLGRHAGVVFSRAVWSCVASSNSGDQRA